ncbi:MAG TPA: hypothetical protein VIW24_00805 [Aldersonia sp.]
MRPYDEPIITFRVLLRGYCEAVERFHASAQTEPIPGILALFEALNWAVTLDDRVAKHWAPAGTQRVEPDGNIKPAIPGKKWLERWCGDQTVTRAIRFARNRVHYQWAEALEPDSTDPPQVEWSWRSTVDLPPAPPDRPDRDGGNAYDTLLAGHPVASTLASIQDLYSQFADLLEPNLGAPTTI